MINYIFPIYEPPSLYFHFYHWNSRIEKKVLWDSDFNHHHLSGLIFKLCLVTRCSTVLNFPHTIPFQPRAQAALLLQHNTHYYYQGSTRNKVKNFNFFRNKLWMYIPRLHIISRTLLICISSLGLWGKSLYVPFCFETDFSSVYLCIRYWCYVTCIIYSANQSLLP